MAEFATSVSLQQLIVANAPQANGLRPWRAFSVEYANSLSGPFTSPRLFTNVPHTPWAARSVYDVTTGTTLFSSRDPGRPAPCTG